MGLIQKHFAHPELLGKLYMLLDYMQKRYVITQQYFKRLCKNYVMFERYSMTNTFLFYINICTKSNKTKMITAVPRQHIFSSVGGGGIKILKYIVNINK